MYSHKQKEQRSRKQKRRHPLGTQAETSCKKALTVSVRNCSLLPGSCPALRRSSSTSSCLSFAFCAFSLSLQASASRWLFSKYCFAAKTVAAHTAPVQTAWLAMSLSSLGQTLLFLFCSRELFQQGLLRSRQHVSRSAHHVDSSQSNPIMQRARHADMANEHADLPTHRCRTRSWDSLPRSLYT